MVDLKDVLKHFRCDDCGLVFSDYKQFLWHRKRHTTWLRSTTAQETLLKENCPLCLVEYPVKYKGVCLEELLGFERPVEAYEWITKAKRLLRCKYYPKCSAEFYHFCKLAKHTKEVHKDARPYACQQCNYTCVRYDHLKRHLFTHNGYRGFKCYLCPKEYTTKVNLIGHLFATHQAANVKSQECPYCEKEFSTLTDLKRHLVLHFPTPTKCHICSKEFHSEKYLQNHVKGHNKMFKCNLCPKEYAKELSLKQHLLSHQEVDVRSLDCNYCGKKCPELDDLRSHLKVHFPTPNTTKCHVCSKELGSKTRLTDHLRRHYRVFKCHLCPKECGAKAHLNSHLLSVHGEVNIKSHDCSYCGKKFPAIGKLKRHLISHMRTPFKCELCSKEFTFRKNLEDHHKNHCPRGDAGSDGLKPQKKGNVRVHGCTYCDKKFGTSTKLKRHIARHFPTSEIAKCHLCTKEFPSKPKLEIHLKSHGAIFFKCHLCGEEFVERINLKRHLLSSHKEVDIKSHKCPHCEKVFFTTSDLRRHSILHLRTPCKCHICPKEFAKESSLKRHLSSHQEVTVSSHDCPYCGVKHADLDELKLHLKIHFPTPKTTMCHLCSKRFSCQRYLKAHIKGHYKMFRCHMCPKECGSKESLNLHLLTSHKEVQVKSYDCSYCDRKFPASSKLKKHERTHFPASETFTCHICSKELYSQHGFKDHLKRHEEKFIHVEKKLFDCEACGQQFTLKSSLKRHLNPEKESKNTLTCNKCPKTFKNLNCYTHHQRSHTEFVCHVCQVKCFSPHGYKVHMKGHGISLNTGAYAKTKAFKCSLCPKKYNKKREFKNHLLEHEGKKSTPHQCKTCGQRFTFKFSLNSHLDPEKETKNPLSCKECSETFYNVNCLQYHKRSHTEGFVCEVCETKCGTQDAFRRHLAKQGVNWDLTV